MRAGRASSEDRAIARRNRAAAFGLLGKIDNDQFIYNAAKKLRLLGHKFWHRVSKLDIYEVVKAATDSDAEEGKDNSDDPPGEPPLTRNGKQPCKRRERMEAGV